MMTDSNKTGPGKVIMERTTVLLILLFLMGSAGGQGTRGVPAMIAGKLTAYIKSHPWEEVYVHTDREEYIAGEEVWFGIYLLDRQSGRSSGLSSIVYFEVLNFNNRPVAQSRILLENGTGHGSITLSDTLSSGDYLIRAYTSMMKNFMPVNCFMKKIAVMNVLGKTGYTRIESIPEVNSAMGLQERNQFIITGPESGGNRLFTFISDARWRRENANTCHIVIQAHGNICYSATVAVSNDSTAIAVPSVLLDPGIGQVAAFDNSGRFVTECYYYIPQLPDDQVNIILTSDYGKRAKISLTAEMARDDISSAGESIFSLSVSEYSEKRFPGIPEYMLFGSEFGIIPEEIRMMAGDVLAGELISRFLTTIKSRWIDWERILADNSPPLKYPAENQYNYLFGNLVSRNSTIILKDRHIFLSTPSKDAFFRYATTDVNGSFSFMLPVNGAPSTLIFQPEFPDRDLSINIISPFSAEYPPIRALPDTLRENVTRRLSRQGGNYQVRKIFNITEEYAYPEPHADSSGWKRFYGKPDIELVMDDYIKLPVMPEVFFELTPGVNLRKKRETYQITITDPVENKAFDNPPVLFIDGVVIIDANLIAGLDPEKVERVEALKARYFVGDYLFYGLVNVITRDGDFRIVDLPDYAVKMPHRIADTFRAFRSPDYSDEKDLRSRIPDLRNTLFWGPGIKAGEDGTTVEFWTSDYLTDYVIDIQGMTSDGKPVSVRKVIKIK